MSIYLNDVPLNKAKEIFNKRIRELGLWKVVRNERIRIDENAMGRVLSEPVYSKLPSPGYNSAAMDGFAVHAKDTEGATIGNPIKLKFGTQTIYVDTGDPIHFQFDAVIPIENVESIGTAGEILNASRNPNSIQIREAVVPWSHIRLMGEDLNPNQLLFCEGHKIGELDLSVMASAGINEITVAAVPKVAIIPTGSELIQIGQQLNNGQIIESNSLFMAGKIKKWGGNPTRIELSKDDIETIARKVNQAAENNDLILVNAGSSAGSEDFTANIIEKKGELLIHGVAVRPGHPVILGIIRNENKFIPIIGIPGFPASAALTMDLFVKELIYVWQGLTLDKEEIISARLTRKVTSPGGDVEFIQVSVARIGNDLVAAPVSKGAGVLSTLANSDGYLVLQEGIQGNQAGDLVNIQLQRNKIEIENNILVIGSHDFLLDEIARYLYKRGRRLSSVNVGSLGGLIALNNCNCHLAGSHLIDPGSGIYNVKFIKEYVTKIKVKVVALANREQGLIIKRGNPKEIKGLEDLLRTDIVFCNRQKGSGTRLLLDYHLKDQGINSSEIIGYDREEYTHMGVASAVISGRADCGMGIAAATMIYDLEFIPLFTERYDLVININEDNSELLTPLFEALHDQKIKKELSKINGYDARIMGNVIEL